MSNVGKGIANRDMPISAFTRKGIPVKKVFALSLCVLSANFFLAPLEASSHDASTASSVCASIVSQGTPESVEQWLVYSRYASHCYLFQARAVSIDALGVRTLALSHRIHEGVRQQVVQHLDGPSVSVERRSHVGRLAWFDASESDSPSTPEAWATHIADNYAITLENDARVAGRSAVQLNFLPHDDERYHHGWWVDQETGLLLKSVLSDSQGRVLETFQMTQLQSPEPYSGSISGDNAYTMPDPGWQVTWLPEGFVAQPIEGSASEAEHRFFSDGLASLSIFAVPVTQTALEPGIHTLGVSTVAVEFATIGEQRWQLIGIGELPPALLLRIVQSVEFE